MIIKKRGYRVELSLETFVIRSRRTRVVKMYPPSEEEMKLYRKAKRLYKKLKKTGLFFGEDTGVEKPITIKIYDWAETVEEYLERVAEWGLEPFAGDVLDEPRNIEDIPEGRTGWDIEDIPEGRTGWSSEELIHED